MRPVAVLVVMIGAVLALAGCGGAPPVDLGAIAPIPGAAEMRAGESPLADSLAETMRGSAGGLASEVRIYRLPAGMGLEEAREHYAVELPGEEWRPAAELETASDSFSTAGWQRDTRDGEQVLMLGYLPALLGEPPVLIVALFGE